MSAADVADFFSHFAMQLTREAERDSVLAMTPGVLDDPGMGTRFALHGIPAFIDTQIALLSGHDAVDAKNRT